MLSLQALQSLTKPNLYQIHEDLFRKDEIIKQYVVKTSDLLSLVGANKLMEKRSTSSIAAEQFATKVTPYQVFPVKEDQKNMVIGSSIVKILVRDRSIPTGIGIHSYRGSTKPEKNYLGITIEKLKEYYFKMEPIQL